MHAHPPGPGFPRQAPSVKMRTNGSDSAGVLIADVSNSSCSPRLRNEGLERQSHADTDSGSAGRRPVDLSFAVDDSAPIEIVGRNFDHNAIAGDDSDKMLSHLSGDVRHDNVSVF